MQLIELYCLTRKNKTDTAEHEHEYKGKMLLEETEDKMSTISMKSCNKWADKFWTIHPSSDTVSESLVTQMHKILIKSRFRSLKTEAGWSIYV